MDESQLTPFGRRMTDRLNKIGKDLVWLARQLTAEGNYTTIGQLEALFIGMYQSRPKEATVGIAIKEEEERQRLKKIAGIGE